MLRYAIVILLVLSLGGIGYALPTPTPQPTSISSLHLDVAPPGLLGFGTTVITTFLGTQPGGQPSWGPLILANDGSTSVLVNFTVPTGQSSPSNYTLLINGRCIKNASGGCVLPQVPVAFTCSQSGVFWINFSAVGYIFTPAEIDCVSPSQVP